MVFFCCGEVCLIPHGALRGQEVRRVLFQEALEFLQPLRLLLAVRASPLLPRGAKGSECCTKLQELITRAVTFNTKLQAIITRALTFNTKLQAVMTRAVTFDTKLQAIISRAVTFAYFSFKCVIFVLTWIQLMLS